MSDEKVILSAAQAIDMLAPGNTVHNYRNPRGMLIGCDYDRADAIKTLEGAELIEIGGNGCKSMGHAIVCHHRDDTYSFFAADMEKIEAYESSLSQTDGKLPL